MTDSLSFTHNTHTYADAHTCRNYEQMLLKVSTVEATLQKKKVLR